MHYRTHAPRRADTKATCDIIHPDDMSRAGKPVETGSALVTGDCGVDRAS